MILFRFEIPKFLLTLFLNLLCMSLTFYCGIFKGLDRTSPWPTCERAPAEAGLLGQGADDHQQDQEEEKVLQV